MFKLILNLTARETKDFSGFKVFQKSAKRKNL